MKFKQSVFEASQDMNAFPKIGLEMKTTAILFLLMLLLANTVVKAENTVLAIPKPQIATQADSQDTRKAVQRELPKSLSGVKPKIVGGTTASRSEFPEFAHIFIDGLDGFVYAWCGGTLISNNKVLTAAHCTANFSAARFFVLPKFYSFNDNFTFSDLIPVALKAVHPNFSPFDYDISILTLTRSSNTSKAKVFGGKDELAGFLATVIGTGTLSEGGALPATLQKVSVPIVTNAVCQASYGVSAITPRMMCAGLNNGGKDACQGDSGGPLWVTFNEEKVQAGIVSWGEGCARPNFYGVYARTSSLVDFILLHAPNAEIVVETAIINIVPILQLLLF